MKLGNLEIYGIIYKIQNLINQKIYIGQTTNIKGFNGRYAARGIGIERVYHCLEYNKKRNSYYNLHLFMSIKKYGFNNYKVNEIFDIAFSKEELDIKEQYYIKYYNSNDSNYGYNISNGGSGVTGLKGLRSSFIKPIVQLDLQGNLIKVWEGEVIASSDLNLDHKQISDCCLKRTKSYAGFQWIFYDDYNTNKKYIYNNNAGTYNKCIIVQYDKSNNIIAEYNSIHDAGRKTNCDYRNIHACLVNKQKTCGGYIWKYKNNSSNINKKHKTKVICITNQECFSSIKEASNKYEVSVTRISRCCGKYYNTAGKNPITGEKLVWMYFDEFMEQNGYTDVSQIPNVIIHNEDQETQLAG